MLDQLWHKFLPQIEARVTVLEQAAAALAQGNLPPDLRAEAHSTAHRLAGSLGTFGLDHGTALAREAENLLAPDAPIDSAAIERFAAIAAEIHTVVLSRT